jgi:uncharacterized protein (DUF885 family)
LCPSSFDQASLWGQNLPVTPAAAPRVFALLVLLGLPAAAAPDAAVDTRLHALFDEAWAERLEEDPLLATSMGEHRYDDRLPGMTGSDLDRRAAAARRFLERLAQIDRRPLSVQDRISADVFERQWRDALAAHDFGSERIPILMDDGFHIAFAELPRQLQVHRVRDYENYLARLRAFPRYMDEHIALMRAALADGVTLPRMVLEGYEVTIHSHVVQDPETSVFFGPFREWQIAVPAAEQERLRSAARLAIRESVVPAYRRFLEFMTREYIPGARQTTGASDLPRGREQYAYLVKSYTTLDVTPDEVHAIGLREVARIRAEMQQVLEQTGFHGDFAAFLHFLRTDARFYARTPEDLLKQAAWIAKQMDGKLPALFGRLPRLPYGIEPVPEHLAPKYTGGRYVEPPAGGTRAGIYWVNTYALDKRPLYTLEALTFHEAVPGHHLQIALQQELGDLPAFRRLASITAFVEGWALYSERLGLEAGFYKDPYSNFGRLTYEMWRACRLVVDTGLHSKGWTRPQAMDYMAQNTALSLHEVRTETDRYISWPGQALAYKMGELKIRALREKAEASLGPRFDVRRFHDAVLRNGAVPLGVLEQQIDTFIMDGGI